MKNIIEQKIYAALKPEFLEVIDESELHAGHAGWREGGNTHFRIRLYSSMLDGKSRVVKHQTIMKLLHDEFASTLHALSIDLVKLD